MRLTTLIALLATPLLLLPMMGCDSSSGGVAETFCDTPAPKDSGKLPGEVCEKNEDCRSNTCATDALTSPTTKVCVRLCASSCGTGLTCSALNVESQGIFYTAVYPRNASGVPLCHCVPACTSVGECAQFGSAYDRCELPGGSGATKACVISATGGGGGGGDGGGGGGGSDATSGGDGTGGTGGADGGGGNVNLLAGCYFTADAPNQGGLLPGEPCDSNDDCVHGLCDSDSPITDNKFKICIKKCGGCSGGLSPTCAEDDNVAAGYSFTCVKAKNSKSEPVSHCARRCDSASGFSGEASCQTLDSGFTSCDFEHAGKEYCGAH